MNKKIICFGNVAFDMVPEKSKVSPDVSYKPCIGGSICNTAVLLSQMGLDVHMVSKTGIDFLSQKIIKALEKKGVNTGYIITNEAVRASLAFARIDKKGESSYLFYKSNGPEISIKPDNLPIDLLEKACLLHAGSSFSYDDHTYASVLSYIKKADSAGVYVTYDPNWRPGRMKKDAISRTRLFSLLPHVDLLKLSVEDALSITELNDLDIALTVISKDLKGEIIVTNGAKGSFYWNKGSRISVPSIKVNVIDTIGAGDAFSAGLIYRYVKCGKKIFNENRKDNLIFASAAASLVCSKSGATDGLTSAQQIEDLLRKNK